VSAVISIGLSPQKLDVKYQSCSKICTNTLGQIDTNNYTNIYLHEIEKYPGIKALIVKNWRQENN
jgi:hypothetical protein